MDFKSIIKNIDKGILDIGYNNKGKCLINLNDNSSIIITGETGTGKSILLDQILLELMNTYTSLEMGFILIDTNGVELSDYANSKYNLFSSINDTNRNEEALFKILREIERRKSLLDEKKVLTVDEYNEISDSKLPLLVVAIDDDKQVLHNKDIGRMIKGIINQIGNLNIKLILSTSDVYNDFFEHDDNVLADIQISFDYTSSDESERINIEDTENLNIGKFIFKSFDEENEYHNYQFDDSYIKEFLN